MNVVLIPVYKEVPDVKEILSFKRCLKILNDHPIALCMPEGFDSSFYDKISFEYGLKLKKIKFNQQYFTSINGYNRLLLSQHFYQEFREYEYMLIYQLDAFVFTDELDYWAMKDHDFIGAPLIGHYADKEFSMQMKVGNGGFSLRKISTFLEAFTYQNKLLNMQEIINRKNIFIWNKFWKRIPLMFFMLFGFRNHFEYYIENWKHNEDNFWAIFLKNTPLELNLPDIETAIQFSFERFPSELYKLNGENLPFGCHAWEKYEYDTFWKKFIEC